MPYFFGKVVSVISNVTSTSDEGHARSELVRIIIMLLIIFGVGGVFTAIRGWLFTLAGQRLVARIRKIVFNTIMVCCSAIGRVVCSA